MNLKVGGHFLALEYCCCHNCEYKWPANAASSASSFILSHRRSFFIFLIPHWHNVAMPEIAIHKVMHITICLHATCNAPKCFRYCYRGAVYAQRTRPGKCYGTSTATLHLSELEPTNGTIIYAFSYTYIYTVWSMYMRVWEWTLNTLYGNTHTHMHTNVQLISWQFPTKFLSASVNVQTYTTKSHCWPASSVYNSI